MILSTHRKTNGTFYLDNLGYTTNPSYLYFPEILNSLIDFNQFLIKPRNKVEGEIELNLHFPEISNIFVTNDTLKFSVQVLDRDYNFSNIAEMEKIYPYYEHTRHVNPTKVIPNKGFVTK